MGRKKNGIPLPGCRRGKRAFSVNKGREGKLSVAIATTATAAAATTASVATTAVSAAVTVATVSTATTSAAATTTVAASATAAAATTVGGAFFTGTGFVDGQIPAFVGLLIEARDGGIHRFGRIHGDEGKAPGAAGVPVRREVNFGHGAEFGEKLADVGFAGGKGQIAHIHLGVHFFV